MGSRFGEKGSQYAQRINDAIAAAMKATESCDLHAMIESLKKVQAMMTTSSETVKGNPILYFLFCYFAPDEIGNLVNQMGQEKAGAREENELMGEFSRIIYNANSKYSFEGQLLQPNGLPA